LVPTWYIIALKKRWGLHGLDYNAADALGFGMILSLKQRPPDLEDLLQRSFASFKNSFSACDFTDNFLNNMFQTYIALGRSYKSRNLCTKDLINPERYWYERIASYKDNEYRSMSNKELTHFLECLHGEPKNVYGLPLQAYTLALKKCILSFSSDFLDKSTIMPNDAASALYFLNIADKVCNDLYAQTRNVDYRKISDLFSAISMLFFPSELGWGGIYCLLNEAVAPFSYSLDQYARINAFRAASVLSDSMELAKGVITNNSILEKMQIMAKRLCTAIAALNNIKHPQACVYTELLCSIILGCTFNPTKQDVNGYITNVVNQRLELDRAAWRQNSR
jgi:hypothetical protein